MEGRKKGGNRTGCDGTSCGNEVDDPLQPVALRLLPSATPSPGLWGNRALGSYVGSAVSETLAGMQDLTGSLGLTNKAK